MVLRATSTNTVSTLPKAVPGPCRGASHAAPGLRNCPLFRGLDWASGVGLIPAGDVLKQHTGAGPGCRLLQKRPHQKRCRKEGVRMRTHGLHFAFVDRREGSVSHGLRETGRAEGGH